MGRVENRELIPTGALRVLGALRDTECMEALARMPVSSQRVLATIKEIPIKEIPTPTTAKEAPLTSEVN